MHPSPGTSVGTVFRYHRKPIRGRDRHRQAGTSARSLFINRDDIFPRQTDAAGHYEIVDAHRHIKATATAFPLNRKAHVDPVPSDLTSEPRRKVRPRLPS